MVAGDGVDVAAGELPLGSASISMEREMGDREWRKKMMIGD